MAGLGGLTTDGVLCAKANNGANDGTVIPPKLSKQKNIRPSILPRGNCSMGIFDLLHP
jgi:hypothetical protein